MLNILTGKKKKKAKKQEGHDGPGDCSPESISPQMNPTFFVPFVQTCDLRGGANFDPKGHHMNKIDKGLLDATYQKSKLYPFKFHRRRILE